MQKSVLGMILAGGRGSRLFPLTITRAKPAVPFAGKFRLIDFALSNFTNSGIYSIYVLTQFKSQSLTEHIQAAWNFGGMVSDHFVIPVPAQMQTGEVWYQGTADAIYQNLNLVREAAPDLVCVFGGDHIYRMDVSQMIAYHEERGADITVAATVVPREEATAFGVIEVDPDWRMVGFQEKPADPAPLPGDPDRCLASMGNYIFSRRILERALEDDARITDSSHDFGKDIIPRRMGDLRIQCYDFTRNRLPGQSGHNVYWRDVGTIESYYAASMDLRDVVPEFNLYNPRWPIRGRQHLSPPAKFVHDAENRQGHAVNSLVCEGTIISGASVINSLVGHDTRIHSYARVEDSILFDNVEIGRGARIRRAIIDKNVRIQEGATIGFDREADARSHFVSSSGIVVLPKAPRFEARVGRVVL